jgi:signal transduction histidine kinase
MTNPHNDRMNAQAPAANVERPASRILVVDDEKSIRLTLQAILQDQGYAVEIAEDANRAQVLLSNGIWDVVVTDIVLPGLSGVELLKAIWATARQVKVIMMTGEPTIETASEAVRAGACDYLTKPVAKNAILRSVATAVQIRQIEDEKRRLEAANREYQNNLEKVVAERTQELQDTNQRLRTALAEIQRGQEELIKRERLGALGQMVGGIAHDFNNALMPIVGLSNFFLSDPHALDNPDQMRADLEAIRSSASAAADVVRRLREFYRPEDALETTSVDLSRLVDHVILLTEPAWKVQAEAEGRKLHVVNDIKDLPAIPANEPRLREALVNLVLNAVDAMPGGGVIRLSAESDAETVTLSLSDTGSGMPDDVRKRCFEPFFTTKGSRGSGLGLAMVYGIVTRHGGRISVASQVGKGTTFVIRLPLPVPAPTVAATQKPHPPVDRASPVFTILVVDDEERALSLIRRFLSFNGHTVLTAVSGQEALDTFRQTSVDLVVTDRAIPDLSGDRIAAEIKRLSPTTPVIMLTGFGDFMEVRREKPAGVDCLLGKPITPDQLQTAVIQAMRSAA